MRTSKKNGRIFNQTIKNIWHKFQDNFENFELNFIKVYERVRNDFCHFLRKGTTRIDLKKSR